VSATFAKEKALLVQGFRLEKVEWLKGAANYRSIGTVTYENGR
jgi:hypothetical protein